LTAQVDCAYVYAAASHADAWLAEHFQKQNALVAGFRRCSIGWPLKQAPRADGEIAVSMRQ
jgi:hypothetical protein